MSSCAALRRTASRFPVFSWPCVGSLLLLAAGCALRQQGAEEVASTLQRFREQNATQAANYSNLHEKAAEQPAAQDRAENTPPAGTLAAYLSIALDDNPAIRKAEQTARARMERIVAATSIADPMLMTKTFPEPVRTAEGDSYFVLNVTQKLPVPEKLDRAGRIALAETRMALQELQRVRLGVIAGVKRAYFQLYIIDKSDSITRENRDVMLGLIDVVRAQVEAGTRGQEDLLRATVELSNLEAQLVELKQRRVTACAALNQLMDRPSATPLPSPAEFEARGVDAALDALFERATESNPELVGIQRQLDRDREKLELARLARWPDFTLGGEWMSMEPRDAFRPPPNPTTGIRPRVSQLSEDGTDNWAIIAGISIPLWLDKIEGGIREARAALAASQEQYHSTQNEIYFRIADAYERVRSGQELAVIFKDTIVPQALQAYEVSRAGYIAGGSDFIFVIDNWQKWLRYRIQYHRLLGELERSVADLEQALGASINEVAKAP